MVKLVIFDVCETLYKSNTSLDFLKFLLADDKKYRISIKIGNSILGRGVNKIFYKVFKYDLVRYLLTKQLKGFEINEISIMSSRFYNEVLEKKLYSDVVSKLKDYKKEGYRVILVSASYDFIIKEISEQLSVDGYYASNMGLKQNKYTGKFSRDNLKIKKEIILENEGNYDQLIVYTDNKTDIDLLDIANQRFIVCNSKNHKFWQDTYGDKANYLFEVK